jgi:hydrogenase maturation protease
VILVDAMPGGDTPGTIYVFEPELDAANDNGDVPINAHGLDPVRVLQLAKRLGRVPQRIIVVGCEPERVESGELTGETLSAVSPRVDAAIGEAVKIVETLARELATSAATSAGGEECRSETGPG